MVDFNFNMLQFLFVVALGRRWLGFESEQDFIKVIDFIVGVMARPMTMAMEKLRIQSPHAPLILTLAALVPLQITLGAFLRGASG